MQCTTTQLDDAKTDYIAGTGVAGESYRASVEITLPDGDELSDAGGGLVFHMNGREDPSSGYMVRFAEGGQEIFWGAYDAEGVFQGLGSSPLDLERGVPHELTLLVRSGDYDILVDDDVLVSGIPLERESGWIGLISFRGPVSFSNFQLTIGEF